jgi:hypothetical protein
MMGEELRLNSPSSGRAVSVPRCARCESPNTEPVTTMRRGTCDADEWFRCEECEHVFPQSREPEL